MAHTTHILGFLGTGPLALDPRFPRPSSALACADCAERASCFTRDSLSNSSNKLSSDPDAAEDEEDDEEEDEDVVVGVGPGSALDIGFTGPSRSALVAMLDSVLVGFRRAAA